MNQKSNAPNCGEVKQMSRFGHLVLFIFPILFRFLFFNKFIIIVIKHEHRTNPVRFGFTDPTDLRLFIPLQSVNYLSKYIHRTPTDDRTKQRARIKLRY